MQKENLKWIDFHKVNPTLKPCLKTFLTEMLTISKMQCHAGPATIISETLDAASSLSPPFMLHLIKYLNCHLSIMHEIVLEHDSPSAAPSDYITSMAIGLILQKTNKSVGKKWLITTADGADETSITTQEIKSALLVLLSSQKISLSKEGISDLPFALINRKHIIQEYCTSLFNVTKELPIGTTIPIKYRKYFTLQNQNTYLNSMHLKLNRHFFNLYQSWTSLYNECIADPLKFIPNLTSFHTISGLFYEILLREARRNHYRPAGQRSLHPNLQEHLHPVTPSAPFRHYRKGKAPATCCKGSAFQLN